MQTSQSASGVHTRKTQTISLPKISQPQLPKGGGALSSINNSFKPDAFTGAGNFVIPLPASPCRGFEPQLQLEYDSASGNGPFGVGFRLSVRQIARDTQKRIPSYTDDDTFVLSGSSELVRKLRRSGDGWEVVRRTLTGDSDWQVTEYRPRVEDAFARVEQWVRLDDGDVHWQVTDQHNVVHIFGRDKNARLVDSRNPRRVLSWLLQSSADAKGNLITYQYKSENDENVPGSISEVGRDQHAQKYLHKVLYGAYTDHNTGEASWHFELVFDYGERDLSKPGITHYTPAASWPVRADSFSTYRSGFEVRTHRLCHAMLVYHRFPHLNQGEPRLIQAIRFFYDQTPGMSFLTGIGEVGFYQNDDDQTEALNSPPVELSYSRSDPTFLFSMGGEYATYLKPGAVTQALRTEFRLNDILLSASARIAVLTYGEWSVSDGGKRFVIKRGYRVEGEQEGVPPGGGSNTRLDVFRPDLAPKFKPIIVEGGTLPGFTNQGGYLMVDLDGGGLPGVLCANDSGLMYWKPRGGGAFSGPQPLSSFPINRLNDGSKTFLNDVAGNGLLDLEVRAEAASGIYPRRADGSWGAFLPFESFPTEADVAGNFIVDTTGDGRNDMLVPQDQQLRVYLSQGYRGYAPAQSRPLSPGVPLTTSASEREVIRFADMFGDGGSHLVRIRDGSVECWPNLGYGYFGARVAMDCAPHFAEELDRSRLFLADIDGSGTADLIYVEPDRILVYFNQSGNSFSREPLIVPMPALWNDIADLQFADLLGNGTACAVLTTLEGPRTHHMYYDFTGGVKPHLLVEADNNMGAVTRVHYAPSTRFYLEDQKAGRPWITRLPFPVQVVEKVEAIYQIAETRQVQRFRYHDGYYDPVEREFRGFGMVEAWDTEQFDFSDPPANAVGDSKDSGAGGRELIAAPSYTKTWYQTGAFFDGGIISKHYGAEYFHGDAGALSLADSVFGPEIKNAGAETIREACAALQGMVLRQEVYGLDIAQNPDLASCPYTVTESSFHARLLQPHGQNKYAAFYVHERESLSYDYERNPDDPRVEHDFTIEIDPWGNVKKSCKVFYPRRAYVRPLSPNPADRVQPEQTRLAAIADVYDYINKTDSFYLLGIPDEQKSFELYGLTPGGRGYFTFEQIAGQLIEALSNQIAYNDKPGGGGPEARIFRWAKQYYVNTDESIAPLADPLPFGEVSPQALIYNSASAIFPAALVEQVYGSRVSQDDLTAAGYVFDQESEYWWDPGIAIGYGSPDQHYLPAQTVDPFGARTMVGYDAFNLALTQLTDAMGNRTSAEPDYQTLALLPRRIIDANNNVSEALFDPLGAVVADSIQGRAGGALVGDSPLSEYQTSVAGRPVIHTPLEEILNDPASYLQNATSFFAYDPFAWRLRRQPPGSLSLQRTIHVYERQAGPGAGGGAGGVGEILQEVSYSDGFGRALQAKQKSSPGPAWAMGEGGQPVEIASDDRWLTTGRTVYNNKGEPVKQYEPYFTATFDYTPEPVLAEFGVTPINHYDALSRLDRTDLPKGYFTKVERTAWVESYYDACDTIIESPYFANRDQLDDDEREALLKSAVFAGTPTQTVFDNLGRAFLSVSQLTRSKEAGPKPEPGRVEMRYLSTRSVLDAQGDVVASIDPRLNEINQASGTSHSNFESVYDMAGRLIFTNSVDAGERWWLRNTMNSLIFTWDGRGFCVGTEYDALQRKKQVRVKGDDGRGLSLDQTVEFINYGDESRNDAPAYPDAAENNQRGRPVEQYDEAGRLTYPVYGITGELLESTRQFRIGYKEEADWQVVNGAVEPGGHLEEKVYYTASAYDAAGRLSYETAPDGANVASSTKLCYRYHPQGWLRQVEVTEPGEAPQPFVRDITYNACGQRTEITYGNGVVSTYQYDRKTFLLTRQRSRRNNRGRGKSLLQDVNYTYDAVGNIVIARFADQEPVFHDNSKVEPRADYTYDSLYRVIEARGREHPALSADLVDSSRQYLAVARPRLNDGNKLASYTQHYIYDEANNLRSMRHAAKDLGRCFTREFQIEGPGTRPATPPSNRMARVCSQSIACEDDGGSTPGTPVCEALQYDANGNMENLEGNRQVYWNYRDNISHVPTVLRGGGKPNDGDYYVYDSSGQRVRKVTQRVLNAQKEIIEIEEKLYFGTMEVLRRLVLEADDTRKAATKLERQSLQVCGGGERFAIVHHWTLSTSGSGPQRGEQQIRYQLDDHLGSVSLELDAEAGLLTYEEYFPYGGTSLMWGKNRLDSALKEYRYSGKERDHTTGLYYYGARYYASWLCRWLSPDPAWTVDGLNLYAFVSGNPITHVDTHGLGLDRTPRKAAQKANEKNASVFKSSRPPRKMGHKGRAMKTPPPSVKRKAVKEWKAIKEAGEIIGAKVELKWKGPSDEEGKTTGVKPYMTGRQSKSWSKIHKAVRDKFAASQKGEIAEPEFANWLAENSHILAGSLYGPNDILNAPPASVHQNTAWLAIESGIKKLDAKFPGRIRIKASGIVPLSGGLAGTLESGRYKVYLGDKKVFDHTVSGTLEYITVDEAEALHQSVVNISDATPALPSKKGLSTSKSAPTEEEMSTGHLSSYRSPAFTGLQIIGGSKLTGTSAFKFLNKIYKSIA
jgi:RHS repeat-associated protein